MLQQGGKHFEMEEEAWFIAMQAVYVTNKDEVEKNLGGGTAKEKALLQGMQYFMDSADYSVYDSKFVATYSTQPGYTALGPLFQPLDPNMWRYLKANGPR